MLHVVKNMTKKNSTKFVNMLYTNFIDLQSYPELKHNKTELTRLVLSKSAVIVLYLVNNKIAGYIVAELMVLNDKRKVIYVNYIFTAKKFRNKGIASKLMSYIEDMAFDLKYDGVLLTCDTDNTQVLDFYMVKGYLYDIMLRTHKKHDILYKNI